MTRRVVRVTPEFFAQLDHLLPAERGPHGEPTAAEFAASDLLDVVEEFATGWDGLFPTVRGRTDVRTLLTKTRLAHAVAVTGQLSPIDGAVELIVIVIDLVGLIDPEAPDDES